MRLGQLTGLERTKIEEELAALLEKIAEYEDILANESRVLAIVKEEALEVKEKYKDERRTSIEHVSGEVDIEDLIPQEDIVLTMTHFGYMKRQKTDAYRTQRRGGRGVMGMTRRDEDFAEEMFVCSTHDYVLMFTNRGRVYRKKGYEFPEGSRTSKGTNIANIIELEQGEKVTSLIKVTDFDAGGYLVMVTRKGIIKRTELEAYKTSRKGGLIALTIDDDDELAWVRLTDGSCDLVVATREGMAIRFAEEDVRPMGRSARG